MPHLSPWWFLPPLLAGLGLGVQALLGGIENRASVESAVDRFGREPALGRVRTSVPVLAGALAAFGAAGNLSASAWPGRAGLVTVIALLSAALAAVLTGLVVSKWAVPSARSEPADPRYALQGQVARVRLAIEAGRSGEVVYELNGRQIVAEARGVDETTLLPDTDVVIERVENDVVYVEAWSRVEQRI